jgi:hypothetical protein
MRKNSKTSGAKNNRRTEGPTAADKPEQRRFADRSAPAGDIRGGEATKPGESPHDSRRREKD